MPEAVTIEAARQALGPVGVLLPVTMAVPAPIDQQRSAVAGLERAGYAAAWTNELLGKDALVQLAILLGATDRMTFGTGIANIWVREPQTLHAAAAELAQGFPHRFVLGLGVGYREQAEGVGRTFGKPVDTMREYLRRMDVRSWVEAPEASYPRLIAANGPRMLALAAEVADGAFPAGQPASFTEQARGVLGPAGLLVVGTSIAVDEAGGIDPSSVVEAVRGHLDAGADHVVIMLPMGGAYAEGIDHLTRLAPALIEATASR